MQNISQSRVPQQAPGHSLAVPLYYGTSSSLQAGRWTPSWPHLPTFCWCPTICDSASKLRCLVSRETGCQHELGDRTVGLQLSSECRLVSSWSSENSANVTWVTHLLLAHEVLPPTLCSTWGSSCSGKSEDELHRWVAFMSFLSTSSSVRSLSTLIGKLRMDVNCKK